MNNATTREQIIKAADDLFYRQGFSHTSFADIAKAVNISRGNFYHHFKTKDDILNAVINARLCTTEQMIESWNEKNSPEERIKSYINTLLVNWPQIKDYGCPIGTLCSEMAKLNHPSKQYVSKVFTLFRMWLQQQFILLGHPTSADAMALQLLSWNQGISALGNAFNDLDYAKQEVEKMYDWVDSLTVRQPKSCS